jgi:hypothetical protein
MITDTDRTAAQMVIDKALPHFSAYSPAHNAQLQTAIALALVASRSAGVDAAADYVDGNWADAHTMAEHLREVAQGNKPMYAE